MYSIIHYLDDRGNDSYQDWLDSLRDRHAKIAVIRRVIRLESGLFGDCKPIRAGIQELRIDVGAGYRVYFATIDKTVILLTCGGNKHSQNHDVELSINRLRNWKDRHDKNAPLP